ncbi:MAG: alpha/beta fold hydrolase [Actinomycetes bacterium]
MLHPAPLTDLAPGWDRAALAPWPGSQEQFGPSTLHVRRASPLALEDVGARAGRSPTPAVFVHGLGGHAMNWTDLMALLRHRLAGAAPDLPGFGRSAPPPDGDYSLDAMVSAMARVVDGQAQAHGRPVVLFGNSLGGAVCVRLAATRPELVSSLVLVSPALPDLRPRRGVLGVPVLATPGLGEQMWRQMTRLPPERQAQAMLALNFADPSVVPQERLDEAVAEYRHRFALPYAGEALSRTTRGLLRAFIDPGPTGLWRQAGNLRCPTLLVYGGRDQLVNVRRSRRASRVIRDSRLVVLPDAGHVAQIEQPVLVARFVVGFLDQVLDADVTSSLASGR